MKIHTLAIGLAALGAAQLGPVPAVAATNLLVNPGFEDGGGSYNGWTTFGQGGVQLSTASGDSIVHSGVEASKIFGEFTGCPIPNFDVTLYLQSFAPTAGMDYEFTGFTYIASADPIPGTITCTTNRAIAKISFFDAAVGGSEISSNEIIIGDGNFPLDQWVPFSVTAPAPTGALRVEVLVLYLQPGCDTGAVFVDDLGFYERMPLTPGPNLLVNPSFDDPLTVGWTAFGNAFREIRGETLPQYAYERRTPPGTLKIFSSFVSGEDSGVFQGFAAAPGSEWDMELYALNTCQEDPIDGASDSYAIAKITFLDNSLPPVEVGAVEEVIVDASTAPGQWVKHRVVAQAPAGTQTVRAYVLFISPSLLGGDAVFVDDLRLAQTVLTGVATDPRPLGFELRQNVPNPFPASTRIDFVLERSDVVDLSVYDVAGRRVATLLRDRVGGGSHSVTWNGRQSDGRPAAAGVYQYVLRTQEGLTSKRMLRIR